MSILSKPYFHNEKAAFKHLEGILWAKGVVCPKCGTCDRAGKLEGVRTKPSEKNPEGVIRHGLWKCYECRKQFTVRVGTVFESAHIPLHKCLQAVHLMASSKKGISAHQLHRILEVQYKSAWFLAHRIREAMRVGKLPPLGGTGKVVEVDETFIGNIKNVRRARGTGHKNVVLTLVERGGAARSFHIDSTSVSDIAPIVNANVKRETDLMTDEARHYGYIGHGFADHGRVNHSKDEYVRYEKERMVSTNTVEGFYSIFKRGMKGVYQHCSEKHLHRYLAEFDFRYSNRSGLGVEDQARADLTIKGVAGKRLTYRQSPSLV